jgi:hypothetical protein
MAVYYPNVVPIRLSNEDVKRTELATQKLQTPRSALIRQVWREYLNTLLEQPTDKTAS